MAPQALSIVADYGISKLRQQSKELAIQTNQRYSSQVEGSRAPSSSPPALTDLLVSIGRRVSPSSSVASGLISGPNGSSTSQSSGSSRNDLEKLEFCDRCFAAYPLEEFKMHTCCG
ncbi:hypothetical protein K439DRAFT_1621884 [Ramaria rubella]|nr:hypothetical protein K439DRAFT_1621884 [Ramaria rubella]